MARHVVTAKQAAAKAEARETIRRGRERFRRDVLDQISALDPADPETLTIATEAVLSAGFEQKELAEWIGVSRTTVSRWAREQNIPRSPVFRKFAVDLLKTHLSDPVDVQETRSSQPRQQQAGRSKRLR